MDRRARVDYGFLRKLVASVSIIALIVIIVGGLLSGARLITVVYRAFVIMTVAKFIGMLLIKVLVNYEEIGRDKD